jgi:predicted PurR-regulated permease PerM
MALANQRGGFMSGVARIDTDIEIDAVMDASASEPREPMPLPQDAKTVFLGGLFVLACLAALFVASEIVLPIVLALVLKLLLQPIVRGGERLRLPRFLGAIAAICLVIGALVGLGVLLKGPASDWAAKLPDAVPRLEEKLRFLVPPVDALRHAIAEIQGGGQSTAPPSEAQPIRFASLFDTLFSGTKALAAGFFTMLLVLFYLLVFGETFLRRFVEILPKFKDKRRAVEISLHIERDVSAYLVTVTAINAVVGIATGVVMFVCGVGDPVLWGASAFALNYVPILGAMVGVVLYALVGVLALGVEWAALLPAGLYLAIHVIEGEVVTPLLMARRFTINPVAVVLGLVFWYWMWGVPGAVLAVPMLAIAKIICDDVPQLRAFGHFLEG